MAVGVAAVGVGAAVVVRWQWCSGATSSSRCGGGATHTTLCISQSRIGFGPTIGTETLRVLALCPFCISTRQGARRAKCERTVSKGAGDYQHAGYMQALCE